MHKYHHESQPNCWGGAAALASSEKWFEDGAVLVVVFIDTEDCLHGVFHELEAGGMCVYRVGWHPAASSSEHSQCHDDSVVTSGGVVVKACQVVF